MPTQWRFVTAAAVFAACVVSAFGLAPSGGTAVDDWVGQASIVVGGPVVYGENSIMGRKAHGGSTEEAPQASLRWGSDWQTADKICTKNRHYAEYSGYWVSTEFLADQAGRETTFYDAVTGLPLFVAPRGRSWGEFEEESRAHGWPSFRDEEVVWANVRVLRTTFYDAVTGPAAVCGAPGAVVGGVRGGVTRPRLAQLPGRGGGVGERAGAARRGDGEHRGHAPGA
eukprot:CAMPEP_0197614200 /NCGR_PEP_ID=MMETSP1326-20131121/59405_1 /TAXON_ID=1155430 /ORGANISM="Genus nov. species nov., Strain RCC2288" /LENGTH=225 /DNA_ID=CAMNT_0043183069 /DNA_START=31 /DNA_END=709 /DNA_ORIENTATION=-